MSEKKVTSTIKIGGDYIPPKIDRVPTIVDGVATVHFKSPLTQGERDSLKVCFRNFCSRTGWSMAQMFIRDQTLVIHKVPEKILRDALEFLEIDQIPKPRTTTTPQPKQPLIKRKPYRTGLSVVAQLARMRA